LNLRISLRCPLHCIVKKLILTYPSPYTHLDLLNMEYYSPSVGGNDTIIPIKKKRGVNIVQ
jgi:hypothetical protein